MTRLETIRDHEPQQKRTAPGSAGFHCVLQPVRPRLPPPSAPQTPPDNAVRIGPPQTWSEGGPCRVRPLPVKRRIQLIRNRTASWAVVHFATFDSTGPDPLRVAGVSLFRGCRRADDGHHLGCPQPAAEPATPEGRTHQPGVHWASQRDGRVRGVRDPVDRVRQRRRNLRASEQVSHVTRRRVGRDVAHARVVF